MKKVKSSDRKKIEVWADWDGLASATAIGDLYATPSRGKEVFSFEYRKEWVQSKAALSLDPSLQLNQGLQYADPDRGNFGLFLDSSPDRWGRILMQKRENQNARLERRTPRTLIESDFLIGVYDLHRLGAIRFKTEADGPFIDHDERFATPPLTSLRELENASLHLEKDNNESDPHYAEWLRQLYAPGSPLGGARPKASVIDEKKQMWVAKFPSHQDRIDVGGWEILVHTLAKKAGLDVPEARSETYSSPYRTFLTKRFDRSLGEKRIHFASAMNLLQRKDGDDHASGSSYLELVELISQTGCEPEKDLEELWRRIVFSICVSNTDDHLRNHGFLLTPTGWKLSPAYDLNPNPAGDGLTLNISETDNAQDLDLARSVAGHFRLKNPRAEEIIKDIKAAVVTWPKLAEKLKISRDEQEQMNPAFRI